MENKLTRLDIAFGPELDDLVTALESLSDDLVVDIDQDLSE